MPESKSERRAPWVATAEIWDGGCGSDLCLGEHAQLIQGVLKGAEAEPGQPSAVRRKHQDTQQGIPGNAVCRLPALGSQSREGERGS